MALCRSTAAEGLEDPRTELCPLVKYFAERKKIFNIHFRNVVGGHHKESGLPNFSEVWPDEGDVDMFELAETLYDAGCTPLATAEALCLYATASEAYLCAQIPTC